MNGFSKKRTKIERMNKDDEEIRMADTNASDFVIPGSSEESQRATS